MVTKEFAQATREVNMVIGFMPENDALKIPMKFKEFLSRVEDKNYFPNINPNVSLSDQKLSDKAKDIIAVIYRTYFCNDTERAELDRILIENQKFYEEQQREEYNPENLFKRASNPLPESQNVIVPKAMANVQQAETVKIPVVETPIVQQQVNEPIIRNNNVSLYGNTNNVGATIGDNGASIVQNIQAQILQDNMVNNREEVSQLPPKLVEEPHIEPIKSPTNFAAEQAQAGNPNLIPTIYKESFFEKIKKLFKKLFGKDK